MFYLRGGLQLLVLRCCFSNKLMLLVFIVIVEFFTFTSAYAVTDSRYALVIGNSDYRFASKLKNPGNDSSDLAATLKKLNFDTTLIQNATKTEIKHSVELFLNRLKKSGGVGLFYYAGHGVQFEGSNYLIPIETKSGTEAEIKNQSFNIASLLDGMRKIKTATNIIILDACRDNPFNNLYQQGSRSVAKSGNRSLIRISIPKLDSGLSKLDAPSNTLIAFATAPGKIALDGSGRNSPYTSKLIESIQRTGLTIGEVFRQVRSSVVEQSNGQQIPWESSSLIQDFYFKHRTFIPMGF